MGNKIIRQKSRSFVTICNDIFKEKKVSLKAKGLYALVMSLPDGWDFSVAGICAIIKEERTAIYTALNELIDFGYCARNMVQSEGKFNGCDYQFFDKKQSPRSGFPHTENPHTGNQQQYNSIINNTLNNNSTINSPIIDDNNPHSCISACARENSLLEVEKSEMLSDETWQEAVCMKTHMTREELRTQIEEFFVYCQCSGTEAHNSVSDAKGHCYNRLTQQLNSNKKTIKFHAYDVQPEDSEKEAKFKTWMRTNHAELENVEKPLSYEEWCALRAEYIEDFESKADCEALMRQVLDQIDANIGYYRMSNIYATMRRKFEERRS